GGAERQQLKLRSWAEAPGILDAMIGSGVRLDDTAAAPPARAAVTFRLLLALGLSFFVPLLVAAYALLTTSRAGPLWPLGLTGLAALAAAAGAALVWGLVSGRADRAVLAPPPVVETYPDAGLAADEPEPAPNRGREEIEALMDSFSGVLTTIEQQSAEI